MPAYIQGTIKLFEANEFKDAESQEPVKFYTYYVQGTEGNTLKLNSRQDFRQYVDEAVTIAFTLKPDYNKPTLFRVSIIDVKPQE